MFGMKIANGPKFYFAPSQPMSVTYSSLKPSKQNNSKEGSLFQIKKRKKRNYPKIINTFLICNYNK